MPCGGRRSNDRPHQQRQAPDPDPQASPEPLRAAGTAAARHAHQPQDRDRRRRAAARAHLADRAAGPQAAQPARRRPQELFNVEYKPITDALSKLPATYDGVKPEKKSRCAWKAASGHPAGRAVAGDPGAGPPRRRRARRESPARAHGRPGARSPACSSGCSSSPPPKETVKKEVTADPVPKAAPVASDGGLGDADRPARRRPRAGAGRRRHRSHRHHHQHGGPDAQAHLPQGGPGEGGLQPAWAADTRLGLSADGRHRHRGEPGDGPQLRSARLRHRPGHGARLRHGLGTVPAGPAGLAARRQVRQHRRLRPGARARRLAAHHPARRLLHRHRQPAGHRYRRLRRPRRRGRPPHLEAPEGRRARDRPRRRQRARLRLSDSDLVKALQQSTQSTTNRAGQRLVERNLNVQPTITVRPGWPLRVIVHKDLVLRAYRGTASK